MFYEENLWSRDVQFDVPLLPINLKRSQRVKHAIVLSYYGIEALDHVTFHRDRDFFSADFVQFFIN